MKLVAISDCRHINFDAIEYFQLFTDSFEDSEMPIIVYPSVEYIDKKQYAMICSFYQSVIFEHELFDNRTNFMGEPLQYNKAMVSINVEKICTVYKKKDDFLVVMESGENFYFPIKGYDILKNKMLNLNCKS